MRAAPNVNGSEGSEREFVSVDAETGVGRDSAKSPPAIVTRLRCCLRHTCVSAMTETLESAYRQHADELIRYATTMVGPDDAADAVIDAMVAVFARSAGASQVRDMRAYLFRAVHHKVVDVIRADTKRRRREVRWQQRRPTVAGPLHTAVDARLMLSSLSEQQRAVVFLTYWCDLGVADVAATMEVSEGAVRKQLARARARLKETVHV